MEGFTRCPHCNTCFKIAEDQLDLRQGRVRCGHCLQAFNAREGFVATPTASLATLDPMSTAQMVAESLSQVIATPANTTTTPLVADDAFSEELLAIQVEKQRRTKQKIFSILQGLASVLLLVTLLGQAVYFFRVDLAARYPNVKPALLTYCQLLQCSVPLPQKAEMMSIESSDLEAVPAQENQIILNALLRNRAPYAQAFPYLELTLNDTQDAPLVRRILRPADYLPSNEAEKRGLRGNHEVVLKVAFNTRDIKPMGYRLVLFYPAK
ncbi:MAG: DUF3426 domain-containing protein [Gallionella sp.]